MNDISATSIADIFSKNVTLIVRISNKLVMKWISRTVPVLKYNFQVLYSSISIFCYVTFATTFMLYILLLVTVKIHIIHHFQTG